MSQRNPSAVDVVVRAKANIARAKFDLALRAKLDKANAAIIQTRAVAGTTHSDQTLSNISVQYKNWDYIGHILMPTVIVDKPSGRYPTYNKRDRLNAPEDLMSNRSRANEITENRGTAPYTTEGYALEGFVDAAQAAAQDAPLDELVDQTAAVNDALAFRQELRHAAVLTNAANFAYSTTLAGVNQWSDYSGTSDPFANITAAKRTIWQPATGPTKIVGYTSAAVFDKLVQHPKIQASFKHVAGLVLPTRQQLAEYLGLDDLLVGESVVDTANEGQTMVTAPMWGKHFGIVRVAGSPGKRTAAFGYTLQFGQKETFQGFDPRHGVKGGYWTKVGWEVGEQVVAPDTGALILNAVA